MVTVLHQLECEINVGKQIYDTACIHNMGVYAEDIIKGACHSFPLMQILVQLEYYPTQRNTVS